jgi:hypothetical protein
MTEVAPVLAGSNLESALKNIAHRIDVSKTAFPGDRLHTVLAFFQAPSSSLNSETLNEFRGRSFHFPGEDPRKVSRAHSHTLRQDRNAQRLI